MSKREIETPRFIVSEKSSKEIAMQMHVTRKTVEGHRARLLRKVGAKSVVGLVLYALRQGLVDL